MRDGGERRLTVREGGNTFQTVYTEMFLQVCRDFPGVPDARTLRAREIKFFYKGLRAELIEHTRPKG